MRKAVIYPAVLTASKRMTLTLFAACLVGMVTLFGVSLRKAETQTTTASTTSLYKVEDLGTLGGSSSYASAINDSGQVVGYSYPAGDQNYHAFLYDSTNGMIDLGTLGNTSSEAKANAINNSGQVVGYSYDSSGQPHAFIYDSTNGMQDLNDLASADYGRTIEQATAINTNSKIAAYGTGPPYGLMTAFVLTPATTATPATYEVQNLGTLFPDDFFPGFFICCSDATGINDSGKVVGSAYDYSGYRIVYLYDESATQEMQGIEGLENATDINDFGQVVGYTYIFGGSYRAFLYDESATPKMQDLGTLGGNSSVPTSINNSGKVVGYSYNSSGSYQAFLKESGQPMVDLNTLIPPDSGWTIKKATAINTDGQIAATGYKAGVGSHALLLTPTNTLSPPTITSPQNNTYDTDGSFSVSGSAPAASTVELFEGETSTGKITKADSSTGAWTIALSGVSEGTHTYSAKAKDAAGNISSASNVVTVTVDKTAPTVISGVSPASGATNVARNTNVTVTFSEKMDPSSINKLTFKLYKCSSTTSTNCTTQVTNVGVTLSTGGLTATLDPFPSPSTTLLGSKTKYKAIVTTGAKDMAGNALDQNSSTTGNQQKVWYFTTGTT